MVRIPDSKNGRDKIINACDKGKIYKEEKIF